MFVSELSWDFITVRVGAGLGFFTVRVGVSMGVY